MAYIGKSPTGTGVRQRYYFTATGGETSLSGADDNGLTLSYSDGAYVDVLLNGIELVAGTDYNTSTANTIAGLSALAASDIVTVTVYDIFTVADTVSAKDGGTFLGNVGLAGNDLILDADADSKIEASTDDTINIISGGTTGLTVDSSGRVLKPALPSFNVTRNVTALTALNGVVDFDTVNHNIGSHYDISNDYFIAPVNGVYHFSLQAFACKSNGNAVDAATAAQVYIEKSTSSSFTATTVIGHSYGYSGTSNAYFNMAISTTADLDANDYVRLRVVAEYLYADSANAYNPIFSGHLVG